MPRKTRRTGVGPSTRGRHKKAKSRETRKWNRLFSKQEGGDASGTRRSA